MKDRVSLYENARAEFDDVMFVLARLSYRDMLNFAGAIQGDADKISDAVAAWEENDATEGEANG